jgi:hypothetical protein
MSLRKELLERELNKLGLRRSGPAASSQDGGVAQQQQQPQSSTSEHPTAVDAVDHGD